MLDFDDSDTWGPMLSLVLSPVVGEPTLSLLRSTSPAFVEDAEARLLASASRDEVIDTMLRWLSAHVIAMYHGTRLTETEKSSVRIHGLRPLNALSRGHRLERVLSRHPSWPEVCGQLPSALARFGQGSRAGGREHQVHVTLSQTGLRSSFNHYLTHGSEFDQHVAHDLLGQTGVDLLVTDGQPAIVKVAIPGSQVISGAHPHFSVDDLRRRGDVPNVVSQFLQVWAFMLSHPTFQSRSLKVDCGAVFREAIPASCIVSIEHVELNHQ